MRNFIIKTPPLPKKKRKVFRAHGDSRSDYYYWLRDDKRENSEILDYLKEENKYTNYWFKKNNTNSKKIFNFYKDSLPKYEESIKTKINKYQYFSTASLAQEYRKYYRIFKNKKKLILDVNKLSKNKKYYDISSINPSRNHKYLAYGEDKIGRREFNIVVKDINKNKDIEKNLCSSTGTIIWNASSNGYFYLKNNPITLITDSLYFHKLGTSSKNDKLIFKEKDKEYNLSISLSRTKNFLLLNISKTECNEFWYLNLNEEIFNLKRFLKRKNKHLYTTLKGKMCLNFLISYLIS